MNDIFGPGARIEKRVFRDYAALRKQVEACRQLGLKIVLTSGTFDLFHIGHGRYLERAKSVLGDPGHTVLIVGVDSDARVRARKGPDRPIVSEKERLEIVCHVRHVDLVFLKPKEKRDFVLLKVVRPDVFVRSRTSKKDGFTKRELAVAKRYCGEVKVLRAQATTSTSARIRRFLINSIAGARDRVDQFHREMIEFLNSLMGGDHEL